METTHVQNIFEICFIVPFFFLFLSFFKDRYTGSVMRSRRSISRSRLWTTIYIYISFLLPFFFSIFMLYLIVGSLLRFDVTFTLQIITRVLRHRNSRTKPILIFKLQHVHALSIFLLTFPFFRAILVFLLYKIDQRLLPYHFFFVLFFPRP